MKGTEALLAQLKNSPAVSQVLRAQAAAPAAAAPGGAAGLQREPPTAARRGKELRGAELRGAGRAGPRRCHTPVPHQRWPLPARGPTAPHLHGAK